MSAQSIAAAEPLPAVPVAGAAEKPATIRAPAR